MDELGNGFDDKVLQWKADAESCMDMTVSRLLLLQLHCILNLCYPVKLYYCMKIGVECHGIMCLYAFNLQSLVSRSSSLVVGDSEHQRDQQTDSSHSSEASSPLSHPGLSEQQPLFQLPISLPVMNFTVDLPDSPISTTSTSSSLQDDSSSTESSTVSSTDTSAESCTSIQSQPGQQAVPYSTEYQPEAEESQSSTAVLNTAPGLKLVIDNIDSTVRPRHQRVDAQTKSLHYVQVYAVKDRINYSDLSHSPPPAGKSVYSLIPSTANYHALKENFNIIVARKLVEFIPFFSEDFKGLVEAHIPHKYSSEMAKKSDVVSYLLL